jgi:hypothetical protein
MTLTLSGPTIAHPEWELVARSEDGAAYRHRRRPFTLIYSVAIESDGHVWIHLSMAHRDRTPTWVELMEAKDWLVGTDRYAYQVAPPRSVYVNINPNVLHLFACLDMDTPDGRILPEFSQIHAGHRTI